MSSLLLQEDTDQSGIELDPIGPKEDDELAEKFDEPAKKSDAVLDRGDENDGGAKEGGDKDSKKPKIRLIKV